MTDLKEQTKTKSELVAKLDLIINYRVERKGWPYTKVHDQVRVPNPQGDYDKGVKMLGIAYAHAQDKHNLDPGAETVIVTGYQIVLQDLVLSTADPRWRKED